MIRINLLPPELKGRKGRTRSAAQAAPSTAFGNLIVALWAVALVAVVGYFAYGRWMEFREVSATAADTKGKVEVLRKEYEENKAKSEQLLALWDRLQTQQEILAVLMPEDRLLWSEKLNMLARLMPEGVFITLLQVDETVKMIETEKSVKARADWKARKEKLAKIDSKETAGPEPPKIEKPLIEQTLKLKGAAIGEDKNERYDRMLRFERALREYEQKNRHNETRHFMDGFGEIAYADIDSDGALMEDSVLDGVPVWTFEMQLPTRLPDTEIAK